MNLPFSPSFFRKMEILQQLLEYESQGDKKHLWEGEKAVMFWAASENHQFLGQDIDWNNVKDALDYCVSKQFITQAKKEELSHQGIRTQILKSLIVHEFAIEKERDEIGSRALINKNGILAGDILIETKNLKIMGFYEFWSNIWHWIFWLGFSLLILQVVKGILDISHQIQLLNGLLFILKYIPFKEFGNILKDHNFYINFSIFPML